MDIIDIVLIVFGTLIAIPLVIELFRNPLLWIIAILFGISL